MSRTLRPSGAPRHRSLADALMTSLPVPLALVAAHLDAATGWSSAPPFVAAVVAAAALLSGRLTATGPDRGSAAATQRGASAADGGRELTTVLFTDIVGSTVLAAALGDARWRVLLDRHDALVRQHLDQYGGREVGSTGDGFLATFDTPARGVRCALAVAAAVRELGLEVRAGLHTTEVERRGHDVAGLGVHVGARVAALAGPGEVLVSRTVTEIVAGAELCFQGRGEHRLRGIPGGWPLFAAVTAGGDGRAACPRAVAIG